VTQERKRSGMASSNTQQQRRKSIENLTNFGCRVKTQNRANTVMGIRERVHSPKKERRGKENLSKHPSFTSPAFPPRA